MASKAGRTARRQKTITKLGFMCNVCKSRTQTRNKNNYNQMVCKGCE